MQPRGLATGPAQSRWRIRRRHVSGCPALALLGAALLGPGCDGAGQEPPPLSGRVLLWNAPPLDLVSVPSSGELLGCPAPLLHEGLEPAGSGWRLAGRGVLRVALSRRGEFRLGIRARTAGPERVLQIRSKSRLLATIRFSDAFKERWVRVSTNLPAGVHGLELDWTGEAPLELQSVQFSAQRAYGPARISLARSRQLQEAQAGEGIDTEEREQLAREHRYRTVYTEDVRDGLLVSVPGQFRISLGAHGPGALLLDAGVRSELPAGAVELSVTSRRRGLLLRQRIELGREDRVWHPIRVELPASGPDEWTFAVAPLQIAPGLSGLLPELVTAAWGRPRLLLGGAGPRPDVIVASCDTLRADRLGPWGSARPASRHLDRLARESLVLRQTVSPSPWTLPSYATLLTSLWPAAHGAGAQVRSERLATASFLRQDIPTWAEAFARAGYSTAALVGSPLLQERMGLLRGFEASTHYRYHSGQATADLVEQIQRWTADEPTFLFVQYMEPHAPYFPPEPLGDAFGPEPLGSAVGDYARRKLGKRPERLTPADRQRIVDLYDGEIVAFDERLGSIIGALRQRGPVRPVLLLHSDHGEELWDHGGFEHGHTLHAELLDVPALIWAPGRLEPGIAAAPAAAADLLPTVAALVGLDPGIGQGLDLLDPGRQPGQAAQRPILSGSLLYGQQQSGLQLGLWKLIVPSAPGAAPRLFWLAGDPGEHLDRSGSEPQRAAALAEVLARGAAASSLAPAGSPDRPLPVSQDPELEQSLRALGYLE